MTFGFTEAEKASFPISRMCRVLEVSQSGYFAWQERPACRRQQQDMVHLAHIRTAFALSNGTYSSPRVHRDRVDGGHEIGRHRMPRLMRENQLIARQKRRFKRTTRRVVGWATSDRLKRDLAAEAQRRALVARNPAPGPVNHSGRASQYCSVDYQALLRRRGILISMSGRGSC
jgi:putative transposase